MSSDSTASARALASRRNGAKSRGPRTAAGKARSSQNALKHGLCAQKVMVLPDEDVAEFAALEAALLEELAPVGALQAALARRIVCATWRLERAERLEVEVFEVRGYADASPGLALIRDGNGTRSIETLMRYRGAAMAELMRSLRTLKALRAEARALADAELAATPPARQCARRLIAGRNEPGKERQNNASRSGPTVEPQPDAPDRDFPTAASATPPTIAPKITQTRDSKVDQRVALRASQRTRHDAPDRGLRGYRPGIVTATASQNETNPRRRTKSTS
jgi:hypothetical protein